MKILVSYVIQKDIGHRYASELIDLKLFPPLYSPDPPEKEVESELVKWIEMKQKGLNEGETIVVLKTLKANC